MKTVRFALILSLFSLFSAVVQAQTLSIRADHWYPMNGKPGSENPGYMIELARTIMKEHGVSVDYQTMPWERALKEVRKGNFDCVVGAYTEDAPDFVFPEESWGLDRTYFWVKKGNKWSYSGLESLEGQVVGIIGGYAYAENFDAHVEKQKDSGMFQSINADNALEKNIKKLAAGRVSTTLESKPVMEAKLKDLGMSGDLVTAGQLGSSSDMYIACSPEKETTKQYIKWIDEGTRKLRASGKLAEILGRYGMSDWKE